ncbi:MAG: DUF362 domain-containing protein [Candidatus Zixiibacteriota bacterium]|nr:MAG: DUF362 domain-containing protein [candidate division Zixibacteria bacterium]
MSLIRKHIADKGWLGWITGFLALSWLLLRSGTNPKRLNYPCQRAAMQVTSGWIVAVIAYLIGSVLLRRTLKFSMAPVVLVGAVWFATAFTDNSYSARRNVDIPLPKWEVESPTSLVFVLDSVPPTTGSLAAGNASVPDAHLSDYAMDTLLSMMETKDIHLYRSAEYPSGIVGADNIVIIKGNFQWTSYNTTHTDRVKGLIWQILQHPDGFSGEIIVCDNTQDLGTGIAENDNNSDDPDQSIIDVVATFYAKGYPVYCLNWYTMWATVAWEYSMGDYYDGYVYESESKISYPKFQTPSGDYYVSLRYGIWNTETSTYDSSQLCIIDFPVLKSHALAGATIAIKNWIGVMTTAYSLGRYGGFMEMHYDYLFGPYALTAKIFAATYPRLTIIDAAWTTTNGPNDLIWVENTKMLLASTDPVAASWYSAKYMLTPIAALPHHTNPDNPGGNYNLNLGYWTDFLVDSAGYDITKDSTAISVYGRELVASEYVCGDATRDGSVNLLDILYVIDYLYNDPPGPPPTPMEAGDPNADGDVNLLDVLYLIDNLYNEPPGPDPLCP